LRIYKTIDEHTTPIKKWPAIMPTTFHSQNKMAERGLALPFVMAL